MTVSRRTFIRTGSAALAAPWAHPLIVHGAAAGVKFRIGVTDWNLKQMAKVEAIEIAKRIGFDGVQVSLGVGEDKLPLADPGVSGPFSPNRSASDFQRLDSHGDPPPHLSEERSAGTEVGRRRPSDHARPRRQDDPAAGSSARGR